MAPAGAEWDRLEAWWRTLHTDEGAGFDRSVRIEASEVEPNVTWGTSPDDVVSVTGVVPDPESFEDPATRGCARRARLWGWSRGRGCRTSPSSMFSAAAAAGSRVCVPPLRLSVVRSRRNPPALVVPARPVKRRGSGRVRSPVHRGRRMARAGLSTCLAMNPDRFRRRALRPRQPQPRGRQGRGADPFDAPAVAAAAASPAASPTYASSPPDGRIVRTRVGHSVLPRQCRHRPHHSGGALKTVSRPRLAAHFERLRREPGKSPTSPNSGSADPDRRRHFGRPEHAAGAFRRLVPGSDAGTPASAAMLPAARTSCRCRPGNRRLPRRPGRFPVDLRHWVSSHGASLRLRADRPARNPDDGGDDGPTRP